MSLLSSLQQYDALLNNSISGDGVRKGNLWVIPSSDEESPHEEIALCNIGVLLPFSLPTMEGPLYLTDMFGLVGLQLALAVEHLNTGNGAIVRDLEGLNDRCNLRFTLEFLDTGLAENKAVDEVIRVTDRSDKPICAFQGASRSAVSMATATITGLRGYPQISAASTSPLLSSNANAPQLYPLFGRTIPSDDAIAVPIMEHFQSQLGIRHLAILYVNDPYGTAFNRGLHEAAASHVTLKTVEIAPIVDDTNVQRAVRELKQTHYQYIFAVINNDDLFQQIMLEAYHQGIAGTGRHTWLFSDASLGAILAATPPTNSPLRMALQGTGVLMASAQHVPSLTAYYDNLNQFLDSPADVDYIISKAPNPEVFNTAPLNLKEFDTNDPYAPFIYDSIIALGLGACNAAAEATNASNYFTGAQHFNAMTRTTFVGTSGPVVFNTETGSREPSSAYYGLNQVVASNGVNNTQSFQVQLSGLFDHGTWREIQPFVYADGGTLPPSDLPEVTLDPNYLGTGWRISGWILCSLGIVLAMGFAMWTRVHQKDRVVTASQPFFLYLICFGCITFFASIIPLGVDEQIAASAEGCTIACNAVIWLLSVGFCVTFSAMFTKTQRVNKIFKNARFTRIKVTPLDVVKPMLLCLGVNFLLLALMAVFAPLQWTVQVLEVDAFERPTETQGFCNWSDSIPFLIPLAAVNLGCLLYAIIQAYEARGISIEFAESEYIFRCMLVLSLAGFLSFPVLVLIHDNNNAFYFFFSATIWITGSLVLLLMFVPKIRFLHQKAKHREDRVRVSIAAGTSSAFGVDASALNFSSTTDEGLLVLSHPKTEAELRERVAHLEGRLRMLTDHCACGQRSGSDENLTIPLNVQEQASHDNEDQRLSPMPSFTLPEKASHSKEDQTSSLTPAGDNPDGSSGDIVSAETPEARVEGE